MIELFSANTPNGWKISIMLEEIGYEYKVTKEQLKETLTEKRLTIELNKKIDDLSKDLLIKRKELIV